MSMRLGRKHYDAALEEKWHVEGEAQLRERLGVEMEKVYLVVEGIGKELLQIWRVLELTPV